MADEAEKLDATKALAGRWHAVQPQFDVIADCLRRESEFATGRLKLRISRVVELLQKQPKCDEVLANRDALEMLLPLLDNRSESPSVESSVRKGVQRVAGSDVYRRNWLQLFWYPALVIIVAFFVSVLLSFTLAPEFEATIHEFTQFGVEPQADLLPAVTRISLGAAGFLRVMWIPISIFVSATVVGIWWCNRRGRIHNPSGLGWWDDQNISVRGAVAVWANHLANLLQVGVGQTEAFDIASREAPKMSLRKLSAALAGRDRIVDDGPNRSYFPLRKYAMLDHALRQVAGPAKVVSLQEVARYYRDRDRYVSTWWMSWLSTALLWFVGLLVLWYFLAMFLPLKELISILSGLTNIGVQGLGN